MEDLPRGEMLIKEGVPTIDPGRLRCLSPSLINQAAAGSSSGLEKIPGGKARPLPPGSNRQ
jgi:hypothetical protein